METGHILDVQFSPQLRTSYDSTHCALWVRWNPKPRPCINLELLEEYSRFIRFVRESGGAYLLGGNSYPLEYLVHASDTPGVYQLGGDLDLFAQAIERQDREALVAYGRACVENLYTLYVGFDLPITTISLVEGDCMGGGFEAALACDVIVAERQAQFGFPEIRFNLFPGMGAASFLTRRLGTARAETIIGNGLIYTADEMQAMGLVNVVVEAGEGQAAVAKFIRERKSTRNGWAGLAQARRRAARLELLELLDIVGIWADVALRLTPRDLRLMRRLVARQGELPGRQIPATRSPWDPPAQPVFVSVA